MSYATDYTYHSLTFAIEELEEIVEKAKAAGEEYADLEFTWEAQEVQDLLEKLTDSAKSEIAFAVMDRIGWDSAHADGFRDAGFEAHWENLEDYKKIEFCEEQIAKTCGSEEFCSGWIQENFRYGSPTDELDFRRFIEDCGFGHLLKGEDQ